MEAKKYASLWPRFIAAAVDAVLLLPLLALLLFLTTALWSGSILTLLPAAAWSILIIFVFNLGIFFLNPYLMSRYGSTVGKMVAGLSVEHVDGSRLTYRQALFREYIAKMASASLLGLGYYWISRDPNRQGWHDMLSDTYVVRKNEAGWLAALAVFVVIIVVTLFSIAYFASSVAGNDNLKKELNILIEKFR
ncbi:RDD family protein, partial [candidate division WWE3 bacterium]|nr:RDD family protein [candidate division WWE3 bacterium]